MSSNKAAGEKKLYRRIYTREDVSLHNSPDDCWVVLFDKVLELTPLLKDENHGALADPILDYAGRDVSHWFDEKTGDIKYRVDPETNLTVPYTPEGRFIHVPPRDPTTTWRHRETPWWKDPQYVIGNITKKERKLRIVNTLTSKEDILEVGCEETLEEIRDRFYQFNAHAASYTWKTILNGEFRPLDMQRTLDENGVVDEDDDFEELNMDPDQYMPIIHLYFNDDLTVA